MLKFPGNIPAVSCGNEAAYPSSSYASLNPALEASEASCGNKSTYPSGDFPQGQIACVMKTSPILPLKHLKHPVATNRPIPPEAWATSGENVSNPASEAYDVSSGNEFNAYPDTMHEHYGVSGGNLSVTTGAIHEEGQQNKNTSTSA